MGKEDYGCFAVYCTVKSKPGLLQKPLNSGNIGIQINLSCETNGLMGLAAVRVV